MRLCEAASSVGAAGWRVGGVEGGGEGGGGRPRHQVGGRVVEGAGRRLVVRLGRAHAWPHVTLAITVCSGGEHEGWACTAERARAEAIPLLLGA